MIQRLLNLSTWATLLLIIQLTGCHSLESHRNTNPYVIRHHTWWNYYARGRLYLQDQEYALAAHDFETALGLRKGARQAYPYDRWKVRTYGVHTLESYFPHRELGVCLYFLNQYDDALTHLETSMQMEPSARTTFYLNRVRTDLAIASAPSPHLSLVTPEPWTSKRTITLSGTATGFNAVARISIAGKAEPIELAKPTIPFSRTLDLKEGQNSIAITVEDVSGKTASSNLMVQADFTPPDIRLSRREKQLEFICRDNIGLKQVTMNGKITAIRKQEVVILLPQPANQAIHLLLEDLAGNQQEWALTKKEVEHLFSTPSAGPPKLKLAQAGQTIELFNPEYELDIRAADDTALTSIQFNGEDILHRPSPLFRTSRRVPLSMGTNSLVVTVEDNDGNYKEQQVTVIRRNPEFLDTHYRLSAVQFPISGELDTIQTGTRIDRIFSQELSEAPARFFLLATANEEEHLKDERNLSAGKMSDPRALLKAGKLLDAELAFHTRTLEDAPGRTIYTEVYTTDGNRKLYTEDVYFENPEELKRSLQALTLKLEQRFPLIKAQVSRLEKQLTINVGSEEGLKKGMRFLVVRSDGDFDSGRVVFHQDHPAELVISKVEPKYAQVILHAEGLDHTIKAGDFVYSR